MANWNPSDPTQTATIDDPAHPGRQQRETPRANQALCDYARLGYRRSLERLFETYRSNPEAPTHSIDTLKKWSLAYAWSARVLVYDEINGKIRQDIYKEHYHSIVNNGLALRHERIDQLKRLYTQLEICLSRPELLWTRQVKKIPTPDGGFELIETQHFNSQLITHLRGIISDISRETNIQVTDGYLQEDESELDFRKLTSAELEIMDRLIKKAQSGTPFKAEDSWM